MLAIIISTIFFGVSFYYLAEFISKPKSKTLHKVLLGISTGVTFVVMLIMFLLEFGIA